MITKHSVFNSIFVNSTFYFFFRTEHNQSYKAYVCDKCDYATDKKKRLDKHMAMDHSIGNFFTSFYSWMKMCKLILWFVRIPFENLLDFWNKVGKPSPNVFKS